MTLTINSVRTVLLTVLCLFSTMCWAETVYKSIDGQGNVTFSDKPMPGAAQVQIMQVTPQQNSPQTKQKVQQLEQQLNNNNQQAQQVGQQRQQLLQQLKVKYAQLQVSEEALAKAQQLANEQFSACLENSANSGGAVTCQTNDLGPLQALVAKTQAKIDKIKIQLDALR